MTIPAAQPHMAAVMDRLDATMPSTIKAQMGVAPPHGAPYVVVYPNSGDIDSWRLCLDNSVMTLRFWGHALGEGPEQSLWVMDHVCQSLIGHRLTVPGRVCNPITQSLGPAPMTRDLTIQPPVYLTVAEFTLISQPGGS